MLFASDDDSKWARGCAEPRMTRVTWKKKRQHTWLGRKGCVRVSPQQPTRWIGGMSSPERSGRIGAAERPMGEVMLAEICRRLRPGCRQLGVAWFRWHGGERRERDGGGRGRVCAWLDGTGLDWTASWIMASRAGRALQMKACATSLSSVASTRAARVVSVWAWARLACVGTEDGDQI